MQGKLKLMTDTIVFEYIVSRSRMKHCKNDKLKHQQKKISLGHSNRHQPTQEAYQISPT